MHVQHFKGYDAVSLDVLGSVDRTKAPRSNLFDEAIVADLLPYQSSFLFHVMSRPSHLYR